MLPSLPPQQSSIIQQHLDQIFGNNSNDNNNINNSFSTQQPQQTLATNNLGNILNGLPFSMPPVSTPIMATSTPPVQSQGQVPVVGNIGRLSHSPPVYRTPAPLVSAASPVPAALSPTPPPPSQQQQQQSAAAPINTAELLKGLTSMGILGGGGTPPPTTAAATTTTTNDSGSAANGPSITSNIAASTATTADNNDDTTTNNKTDEKDGADESTEKTISLDDFGTFKLESKDLQMCVLLFLSFIRLSKNKKRDFLYRHFFHLNFSFYSLIFFTILLFSLQKPISFCIYIYTYFCFVFVVTTVVDLCNLYCVKQKKINNHNHHHNEITGTHIHITT